MKIIQRTIAGGFDAAARLAHDIVEDLNDDRHHVASISHHSVNGSILVVVAYVEEGSSISGLPKVVYASGGASGGGGVRP